MDLYNVFYPSRLNRRRQFVRINANSLKGCIFWFKIRNDDIIYEWTFEASEVSLKIK